MCKTIVIIITLAILENVIMLFCTYELLVEGINSDFTATNMLDGQAITLLIYLIELMLVIISLIAIYATVVVLLVRNKKVICKIIYKYFLI